METPETFPMYPPNTLYNYKVLIVLHFSLYNLTNKIYNGQTVLHHYIALKLFSLLQVRSKAILHKFESFPYAFHQQK